MSVIRFDTPGAIISRSIGQTADFNLGRCESALSEIAAVCFPGLVGQCVEPHEVVEIVRRTLSGDVPAIDQEVSE